MYLDGVLHFNDIEIYRGILMPFKSRLYIYTYIYKYINIYIYKSMNEKRSSCIRNLEIVHLHNFTLEQMTVSERCTFNKQTGGSLF